MNMICGLCTAPHPRGRLCLFATELVVSYHQLVAGTGSCTGNIPPMFQRPDYREKSKWDIRGT
jgi:hypothetical protein